MPDLIPFRKPEGGEFYSFSMSFDDAAVQELFSHGLSREQVFQRIMESLAEAIWEALPMPVTQLPS